MALNVSSYVRLLHEPTSDPTSSYARSSFLTSVAHFTRHQSQKPLFPITFMFDALKTCAVAPLNSSTRLNLLSASHRSNIT